MSKKGYKAHYKGKNYKPTFVIISILWILHYFFEVNSHLMLVFLVLGIMYIIHNLSDRIPLVKKDEKLANATFQVNNLTGSPTQETIFLEQHGRL